MKQLVWILNSSLLVLFFMSQLLLFTLQKAVPRRIVMTAGAFIAHEAEVVEPVDLAMIYRNDLFGTYEEPKIMKPERLDETIAAIPVAPKIIIPQIPIEKAPTFFTPLDVVLKGVIFVQDDPASSLAIVQSKKTKEDQNYQVGDLIEDAQILKIFPNRIIIIRSNGQQETLYLREEDAVNDFDVEINSLPKTVIQAVDGDKYKINIDEFAKRIRSLGEFINILDLTTAYKQGKSFGCRIGNIGQDSLGQMLGLIVDDIVVKIDDFNVDDLQNRIKIYDHVLQKQAGDIIEVVILRDNTTITLVYGLVNNDMRNVSFVQHDKQLDQAQQKNKESDAVVIQSMTQKSVESHEQNNDYDDIEQYASYSVITDKKSENALSSLVVPTTNQQTLNESIGQKKRLMNEQTKLNPAVKNMKAQDRQNMLKQTNRNVIFNGIK